MAFEQWRKEAGEMIEINNEDVFRNQVKTNYEFSQWAGRTKEGDSRVQLKDFVLPSEGIDRWTLEQDEELPAGERQQRVLRYVFNGRAAGSQRVVVTVFECNSVNDAHESLIDVVMTYMAPSLPRCETKGLEIGDICFGSHGEVNLSVIFARFNILVEIQSATPGPVSVDELARGVDSLIFNQYLKTRGT
jgi:hypothetical protein